MVWTGVLKAVLLLSFITSSTGIDDPGTERINDPGTERINTEALTHIINVIHNHARNVFSGSGSTTQDIQQYAVAVRVTKNECFTPGLTSPIARDLGSTQFINTIRNKEVFQTDHVIAAKYKNEKHSEYRLLIENNQTVIKSLLENKTGRQDDDCVIFYTYNSPCLKMCLNTDNYSNQLAKDKEREKKGKKPLYTYKCIIPYLDIFTTHTGPKAFVFKQIYREDMGTSTLRQQFKMLDNKVDLYQCNDDCKLCKDNMNFCVQDGDLAG